MIIAVGADANGEGLKAQLVSYLRSTGHQVVEIEVAPPEGTVVDYPDVAVAVATEVARAHVDRALLVCGTGIGMAIAANKVAGVRAANVADAYSAERAVKSNNAQILCLGSQVVGEEHAKVLLDHWLSSTFAGGRSARKVAKLVELDRQREHVANA